MNLLDENIPDDLRALLLSWHISIRQIGHEMARKGRQDPVIITLLHQAFEACFADALEWQTLSFAHFPGAEDLVPQTFPLLKVLPENIE
jgi:hypothetical protein